MAKILAKIILITIIVTLANTTSAIFNNESGQMQIAYANDSATRDFQPAIIPRPDNLPGPTDLSDDNKSNRKIFGEAVLPKIAVYLIGLTGGLSLLFLIIGGARFAMSYANEEDIGNAKNQVIYSLVGLLVSMLSYAAVAIVVNLKFEGDKTPSTLEKASDESEKAPNN